MKNLCLLTLSIGKKANSISDTSKNKVLLQSVSVFFMQFLETLYPLQIPEKNHNGSEINAIK